MSATRPTIHDVAEAARVSIKTVSRVMNCDGGVAETTAQRVRSAVDALGYRTNPSARSLRTGQDQAVGLLVESIADPFFASLTDAVEEAARDAGLFLLMGSAGRTPDQERAVILGLLNRSVCGLIVVPCYLRYDAECLPIGPAGVPVVFIDRPPGDFDGDVVVVDNTATAKECTEHLISYGHRRVAFVGADVSRYPINARLAGYRQALGVHGVTYDPDLVVSHSTFLPPNDLLLTRVLAREDPPTAVLCANAASSLQVVLELHRSKRTDVAMVSFDDFPIAEVLDPAISVARQDPALMGRRAFEILRTRMAGNRAASQRVVLPTSFVARGSGEIRPAPVLPRSAESLPITRR